MTTYVALLRGINSGQNPSQSMENLKKVFTDLGFKNVQTVIASGNVIFATDEKNKPALETKIEQAIQDKLGFSSSTIVWTKEQIAHLVKQDPFKALTADTDHKPHVSFIKSSVTHDFTFPHQGKGYTILGDVDGALCSVINPNETKTPDYMANYYFICRIYQR